jgi:hypothetical protein
MSKFLSNLAARSLGAFETIAPRVPSRFEPTRRANGLLAGRAPAIADSLRDDFGMEGTASAEAPAADPVEDGSRARRQIGPMDSLLHQPGPTPWFSESDPGMRGIQPAASIVPHAESQVRTTREPASRGWRIPGSPSADSAPVQPLDPAPTPSSAPAFTLSSAQRREAKKGETQGEGTRRIGLAQSLTARSSRRSSPGVQDSDMGALDPDLFVSGSISSPGQMEDSPSTVGSVLASQHAKDRGKSVAGDRERGSVRPKASFPAMPASVEPASAGESSPDESTTGSQAATSAGRGWPGDIGRSFSLKADRSIVPATGQETATRAASLTATRAGSAELASAAARLAVQNLLPAPQPSADAASEPAIRVTIGRVEVRAVFPEQAAKRTPPPRFRPKVSLDDYLSRGSGGRR